ncbi:hypothetical protein [Granulicella sp. S156]|uniref:hypothetical protein n=1 Tax=Granulicella sp. S156 TaxID=1747224 RepID=UPI00131D7019|nr:hypothetical protein [Granulicella sp. S156]
MKGKQAVFFVVLLVLFFACIFSPFYLSDDPAQAANSGLRKALIPVLQEYRSLQAQAAAGKLSGKTDPALATARQHLNQAERFVPLFESENGRHANNHAEGALDAYARNVEDLAEAKKSIQSSLVGGDSTSSGIELTQSADRAQRDFTIASNALAEPAHQAWGVTLQGILFPLGLMILLPSIFLVGFGPSAMRALRDRGIRRTGVRMTATVISSSKTGLMVNYVPQYEVTVRLPTGDTTKVILLAYAGAPPGMELQVIVDPANPSKAVVV